MAHVAFVESNTTGTGRLVVERLLARGDRVSFITHRAERYPFLQPPRPPNLHVITADTNDVEALARCVEGLVREGPVDALLTFSTFYVPTVATVAARCGLRYLQPRAAHACHHKHQARAVLREAGLPGPDFHVLSSEEEARHVAGRIRYPCVVKPPAESSSAGVRRVESADELLSHFRALHGRAVNERGQALSGEVLVESLLEGPEFSVETMTLADGSTRVLGVTRKYLSPPPHFVEMGHDFPAPLPEAERQALEQAVLAALRAVGFDFGPAHTEIRLTPTGPVVVEINPRLAGGMIPELVRYATGVDPLAATLELAMGQPVDLTPTRREVAAIRFITAEVAGQLVRVEGLEEARRLPGVQLAVVEKALGASIRPPESGMDRLGYVIASGPVREQVIASLDEALGRIRLVVS
ncbi:ATP-grasp domain-containing protein [Hyalangium rubrum]|uniref:ATP-grasp domain-containing protein n=1 Tax=Hyalangium rubrum TaxID=3103134 RepID=A0ABU5GVC1_9BACT|nr:ATP-grasp domain-containing protein [Hyalangium sp. s54d21]MDY7225124.1 ATP-grasp domain-containing protein [Hyalangium sp. s54d21]